MISIRDFNPLPRKEGDEAAAASVAEVYKHFNPLPRKEGDFVTASTGTREELFQSAPS